MQHQYALVNRPAGLGTIPRDLEFTVTPRPAPGQPHHDMARHGILVTTRPLTHEELRNFELAPLAQGDVLTDFVNAVAADMGKYAAAYVEMHDSKPDHFKESVLDRTSRVGNGVRYSIENDNNFVILVHAKLMESVSMQFA